MKTFVFVLAGGSGTRLAPLSLTAPGKLPKQFLALVGKKTMLQETVDRIPAGNEIVIVPEKHYEQAVQEQVGAKIKIIAEPFGCNTAPAIGLSAFYALKQTRDENTVLFFLPADHIMDKTAFQKYFKIAVEQAVQTQKIITLGIKPDRPETGYGYIKVKTAAEITAVDSFVEKPDLKTAEKYLADGNYFWNAGIFCMTVKTILNALRNDAPVIYDCLKKIDLSNDLQPEIAREYAGIKQAKQNISIDYAVMEKEAQNMLLIKVGTELEWNDVGGWVALEKYYPADKNNNLIFNYLDLQINLHDCRDLLVVTSENGILVTTQVLGQRAKEIIPGITAGKNNELIDSPGTALNNSSKLYVGCIGLDSYQIDCENNKLSIKKLPV